MKDRLEILTGNSPRSSSLNTSTTADIPDIDFGALLDELISYLSPALHVIKEGIAWLDANAADYWSAFRLFVTSHPYISISIPVGLVLLFVYGPAVIGITFAFLSQLVTLPFQFLAKFFLLTANFFWLLLGFSSRLLANIFSLITQTLWPLLNLCLRQLLNILGFTPSVARGINGYAGDICDVVLINLCIGSFAALWQHFVNGGNVASNSVFSLLQSLGATIAFAL